MSKPQGYFHLRIRSIAKGKGKKRAVYILRLEGYREREDLRGQGHGNLAAWCAGDPVEFFATADRHERLNGTVGKELTVAIPRDLPPGAQLELIDLLVRYIVGASHGFCYGFHVVRSSDGGTNPHVHLLWSERIDDGHPRSRQQYFSRAVGRTRDGKPVWVDPAKGGCRKDRRFALFARARRGYAASPELLKLRHWWAEQCNRALRENGLRQEASERSYQAQHIPLQPGVHVYDSGRQIEARGGLSHRAQRNRAIMATNQAARAASIKMALERSMETAQLGQSGTRQRPPPLDPRSYALEIELLANVDEELNRSLLRRLREHIECTAIGGYTALNIEIIKEGRARISWSERTHDLRRVPLVQEWWLAERQAAIGQLQEAESSATKDDEPPQTRYRRRI